MDEHVTDADLHAYIDGQLDLGHRIEVEAHLEAHPEQAAALMGELRRRDELRLFLAEDGPPPAAETAALGRRLGRALGRRALVPRLRGGLAAAGLIGLGWVGHAQLGGPVAIDPAVATHPAAVLADDAAQAWHVAQLELAAAGPPPAALQAAPGSGRPPAAPESLRRIGADEIPWDGGTADLQLLVTPQGDELVLLAAETPTSGTEPPAATSVEGVTTVSWWSGGRAYALSGDLPTPRLLALARNLAPTS